ncbi:hypothetical protein [Burkholderia ubonensis]|uniref:hypothetical protein n=1 Tax=Burkholderia ubonensis TaxID=101571 RepID=UPI000757652A|nr:hypothetical protein [Burkholderia ubonensis]KVL03881.1 beta-lactoglobulin I [Burkholderia ubonensis]KVQ60319.1 beta-lactoglobulin I [Burkholderia ubonensis]
MLYAILSPDHDAPWGYCVFDRAPTPEEMADHLAHAAGLESRDDWLELHHIDSLGWAPVH